MRNFITRVLARWAANTFGLWIAGRLIASVDFSDSIGVLLAGGLVLALVNAVLKPILVIFSLPFIFLSLGLFMLIINGLIVWLAAAFVPGLRIETFIGAVLAGLVISLVNYSVSMLLEERS